MADTEATAGQLLANFSTSAAAIVHGSDGRTAYSYDDLGSGIDAMPIIDLHASSPYAYTDCNGWVNYALNSVSPLHFAVLSAVRHQPYFTTGDIHGVDDEGDPTTLPALDESNQPFARAFVLSHDFSHEPAVESAPAATDGFAQVSDFGDLQAGDVIAYATGIFSDLTNPALPSTGDTGHTMVVTDKPVPIALGADATVHTLDALSPQDPVAHIYAVSMVDSSDVVHMTSNNLTGSSASDDRPTELVDGKVSYTLGAKDAAAPDGAGKLHAGGLGTGTMWFATDQAGKPLGFKFDADDGWHPTGAAGKAPAEGALITAARLEQNIDLSLLPATSMSNGMLEVTLMANRTETLDGEDDAAAEQVSGHGGLRVDGSGTLTLSATDSFDGGIELQGVTLVLAAAGAAGSGVIRTDAGTANSIAIDAGAATVVGGGDDTVSAAAAGSVVTGGHTLKFSGTGASTVHGGAGSATISGGSGGVYVGGTAGHNLLQGAGQSALWGGGADDLLIGARGDLLGAAAGDNTTLVGGQQDVLVDADGTHGFTGSGATVYGATAGGADTVVGSGGFTLVGRGGRTTMFGGDGDGVTWAGSTRLTDVAGAGRGTLIAGSGHSDLWIGADAGAQTIVALAGAGGGSVDVFGFRAGVDSFRSAGYGPPTNIHVARGGSMVLTLPDHTTVTFIDAVPPS